MDEMKMFFEAFKDELYKDIVPGQQEMRAGPDEIKESHNPMKDEIKRDKAAGKDELKASLTSQMKELLDEKL